MEHLSDSKVDVEVKKTHRLNFFFFSDATVTCGPRADPALSKPLVNIETEEMMTPRDAADGHICHAETPEKVKMVKHRDISDISSLDTFKKDTTCEKITFDTKMKVPKDSLNADANEFIPGSFGSSLLPAILPSVPAPPLVASIPTITIPAMAMPPGLEMCGLGMNGMTSIWDEVTQFGMDSHAWESERSGTTLSTEASPKELVEESEEGTEVRILKLATCLLRFLLQGPVLETSDFLKVIETQLGEAQDSGPWRQRDLKMVSFSSQDLALLDARLAALLPKLSPEMLARLPRHLNLDSDPTRPSLWSFKAPPELRRMIQKEKWPTEVDTSSGFSITFLSAEASGNLPLDRMLKFQRAGIACLQGDIHPDVVSGIIGKGYGRCSSNGPSATIIWDRSVWTLCASHERDAGLAVDLISEDQAIRVACWQPTLEQSCDASHFLVADSHYLLADNVNLVVCADLSLLGGTSSAGLVPPLLGLQSAMFEVLGQEVLVPKLPRSEPVSLWDPCGIFFRGVEPAAALSGHTEGYLAGEDVHSFPDGKPILFAEFASSDPNPKK